MNRVLFFFSNYLYSNTSVFLLLYCNRLSSSSPSTVFMISFNESFLISLCLEWFLYGKICALTLNLAEEIELFPGTGLYSGIFAIYLQCPKKDSRTGIIVFYLLCLLYVLSTATVVCDLLSATVAYSSQYKVSNNLICNLKNMFFIGSTGLRGDNYNSHCGCPSHTKRLL